MAQSTHPDTGDGFPDALVADVLDDALASGARTYGITGLQGTGKSTLARQVAGLARSRGQPVAVLSIDDCYLDREARVELGRTVHPLLATRGPPGTHDLELACRTLDALRAGEAVRLPRFDKIADRRLPVAQWPRIEGVVPGSGPGQVLVLFEGWFLKTPPQAAAQLAMPLNALERDEDGDGRWRRYCNDALGCDYPPLWQRIDRLLWLQGPGFDIVPQWRWQQEQTLQATHPDRQAMTRAQVERFVQFFERTSRQAQRTLPGIADRSVHLDAERNRFTPPRR